MTYLTKNVRVLHQGYEELYQLSYQTAEQMVTDSTELAEFGIDQAEIDGFKNLSVSFNNRDFDEKFLFNQKLKTDAKTKASVELMRAIYKLQTKVDLEWIDLGIDFSIFEFGAISRDNDLELLHKAKAGVNLLTASDTVSVDLTILNDLTQKVDAFEKAIDEQRFAFLQRKVGTKLRQAEANALYFQMRKYRELGKRMWLLNGDQERSDSYLMPASRYNNSDSDEEDVPLTEMESF
jgi:hypothetical protein